MGAVKDDDYQSIAPHLHDAQGRRCCGFINLADADGAQLFQNADGHSILPARVAAYHYVLSAIVPPGITDDRAQIPNLYLSEATIYHGTCCLREEVSRERNSLSMFYNHWHALGLERQGTLLGRMIDNNAKDWRFRGDIHLLKAALYWQPESIIGGIYRRLALERTAASIALAGEQYRQRLAEVLPELQAISPEALTLLQLDQPVPDITIDPSYAIALRELSRLPISEREMGFFNAHLEHIDTHGIAPDTPIVVIPEWIPDSRHPTTSPDAINHGQLRWQGRLGGQQVSLSLDMNSRRFESTVIDGQMTITHKVYQPTQPPRRDNYFMPAYLIGTSINGINKGTAEMAAGHQSSESMRHLQEDFRSFVTELMNPLVISDGVQRLFPKVVANIQQQRAEYYVRLGCVGVMHTPKAQQMRESLDKMLAPRLLEAGYSAASMTRLRNDTIQKCLEQGASSVAFAGYDAERRQIVVQTDLSEPVVLRESDSATLAAGPITNHLLPLVTPPDPSC